MGGPQSLGDRTKILYIGGYSRSGSTLLLRLLGELPGLVAVGELFDIWDRSYRQNQLCGCGCAFHECPFWREVTLKAFDCEPADLPADDYQMQRRKMHGVSVPRLWLPILRSPRYRAELRSYARVLERLYRAIADVSGARFIIDSSKEPHQAWVLREAPGVELHVVHLVRDSRAVAFSWRRFKPRPEVHWGVQHMDRHTVTRSSLEWDVHNLLVSTRQASLASYSLVRYEDLVSRPKVALGRIGRAIGETWDLGALLARQELSLRPSHTASGNPSRFKTGSTSLRKDDEWMEKMSRHKRLLSTALTAPGLVRYGYPLRSRSP
jgi:Sulfotransferase family